MLEGLTSSVCLVYLNDVIIFGESEGELLNNVQVMLERYRSAGLTLDPKKCHFLCEKVPFLRHVVSAQGIATDPEKVPVIRDWPTPQSGEEV